MSAKRTRASIRVQVAVMVDLGTVWGPDSTIAQVRRQGEEEAINRLQRAALAEMRWAEMTSAMPSAQWLRHSPDGMAQIVRAAKAYAARSTT